jgi:hypothetical protein
MWNRSLFTLALAALSTTFTYGQVRLEHKLREGATYTNLVTSNVDQTLSIAGMDVDTKVETTAKTKVTIGNRDVSGTLRVQEKVESMQINMNTQGGQYTFDSANPDNKGASPLEMLRDVHKAMLKNVSTVVYDKSNKVQAVEIDQNLLGSLPNEVRDLVKSQLDPENLKKTANQENDKLPSDPVKKGDTWTRTEDANFGAGQLMTFQTEYTYQGEVEKDGRKLDKITSKVLSVTFALAEDSPLPLKLKGSDLKATESEGTMLFDRETGHFVETTGNTRIAGDLGFTLNGMDLPSKLDLKLKVTSSVAK